MSSHKKWYLLYNNQYHLGPFDSKAILFKIKAKELSVDDLIWAEGMNEWGLIKNIFKIEDSILDQEKIIQEKIIKNDISNNEETETHSLAKNMLFDKEINFPINTESVNDQKNIIEKIEVNTNIEEINLPALPIWDVSNTNSVPIELPPLPSFSDDTDKQADVEPSQKLITKHTIKKNNSIKYILSFFLLLIISIVLLALFFFTDLFQKKNNGIKLSEGKVFYLQSFPNKQKVKLKIILNARNTILVSTNRFKQGRAFLSFSSIKDQIFSDKKVSFNVNVNFNNNIGVIHKLIFMEGIKLIPGLYNVSFLLKKESFRDKIRNIYYKLPKSFSSKVLIYRGSHKKFKNRLLQFKLKKYLTLIDPLNEKLGLIKTLKNILKDYNSLLKKSLLIKGRKNRRKRKKFLTSYYNKNIGPLLTNLVVSNIHSKDKIIYENIIKLGKEFGSLVVKTIQKSEKRFFKKNVMIYIVRFNSIKSKLDQSETLIRKQIKKYKKEFSVKQ